MGVRGYEATPDTVQLFPERLDSPLRWKAARRVFVNSMSDVFHKDVPDKFILEMFLTMRAAALARSHIFQILTKRPGRAVAWWNAHQHFFSGEWPPNIWIGTSVESQKYAPRITVLARIPAPIKFVSAEPLLEQIDLSRWLKAGLIQWVIVGGESGPRARPMKVEWARFIRKQCSNADVALFIKQLGGAGHVPSSGVRVRHPVDVV